MKKSQGLLKPVVISFMAALFIYFIFYAGIEHRRTRQGPWQVSFMKNSDGVPALLISQPTLAITNVQIIFPDEMTGSN
jgi:hypothetical protein